MENMREIIEVELQEIWNMAAEEIESTGKSQFELIVDLIIQKMNWAAARGKEELEQDISEGINEQFILRGLIKND